MRKPIDINAGIHPHDPEYRDDFDYEAEMERYELEREMEEDDKRFNQNLYHYVIYQESFRD